MASINAAKRNRLADKTFALPKERKYPINDISHARNALARSSGKPEEDQVKRAVYAKYPSLKPTTKELDPDLAAHDQYTAEADGVDDDSAQPAWVGDADVWNQAKTAARGVDDSRGLDEDSIYPFATWYYVNRLGGSLVEKAAVVKMTDSDAAALHILNAGVDNTSARGD